MLSARMTVPAGLFGLCLVCFSRFFGSVSVVILIFGAVLCLIGLVGEGRATKVMGVIGLLIAAYFFQQLRP